DKAGIARPGVPFFTTDTDPENQAIIAAVCEEAGAPLTLVGKADVCALETHLAQMHLTPVPEESLINAAYQKWNAALSLSVLRLFQPGLDERAVLERFIAARLPGRFWRVEEHVYADMAHNIEKMRALVGEV